MKASEKTLQRGFGQFCPVALASEVLTQRWTLLIIREMCAGSARFNDIRRGVPRMSATLLRQRLETLECAGIIERRRRPDSEAHEYALTQAGLELKPALAAIGEWGQRWARDIRPEDLDPGWLVWSMHRRLNTEEMPPGRTVIEIEFSGAPANQRRFWLIHQGGEVDVCLKPPGFPIDVRLRTSVRVLAEVWRGIRPLTDGIRSGGMHIEGKPSLCRAFPRWLRLSVHAAVQRMR